MKNLVLLALLALAGCSTTWVHDVTASPDGKLVTVVGAEVSTFSLAVQQPLQWACVRGDNSRLTCRAISNKLPRRD